MPRESNDISSPINLKALLLISGPRNLANTFFIDRHSKLFSYVYYGNEHLSLESGRALVVNEKVFYFFPFEANWGLWELVSVFVFFAPPPKDPTYQLLKIENIINLSTKQQTWLKWTKLNKNDFTCWGPNHSPLTLSFFPLLYSVIFTPLSALKCSKQRTSRPLSRSDILNELVHLSIIFQTFQ